MRNFLLAVLTIGMLILWSDKTQTDARLKELENQAWGQCPELASDSDYPLGHPCSSSSTPMYAPSSYPQAGH